MGKNNLPSPVAGRDYWPDCDANTLAEARVIQGDPKRLAAATKAAQKVAERKTEEAVAMRRVAGASPGKTPKKHHSSDVKMVDSTVKKV